MKTFLFVLSIISLPVMASSQVKITTTQFQSLYMENDKWISSRPVFEQHVWEVQFGRIFCKTMNNAYYKIKKFYTRGKNDIYFCEGENGSEVVIVILNQGEKIVVNFKGYGEPLAMVFKAENSSR